MKQKLLNLKAWMLLLVFTLVSGVVWADTATSKSLSSKSTSAQTVEAGKTITYKCSSSNNYENPARIYKDKTFTVSSTDGVTITKIEITSPSDYPANAFTANDGDYEATTTAGTWTGEATSVIFTASVQVRVSSITVTYSADASTATAPTLPESCIFTSDSYDVTITNGESGATVYYTTDGTTPTTSSESFTGASKTINITATTTVKAMAVISGKDNSAVVTATYTKETSIANTAETAYTTAEAKALIDAGSEQLKTTDVYVKGTVSKVDSYSEKYGSITYWLDDNAFEVYGGLNDNAEKFTSLNDIKVGAEVIVKGKIKKFGTDPVVYEMDSNNWLVSYTAPAASKNTATLTLGTYQNALITGFDDEYTVTYDGDADVTVTSSDEAVAEAICVDGTVMVSAVKAGTTTITVSAAETDNYYAASKSYTLTVTDPAPAAQLPFDFDGGVADIAKTTGMSQTGLGTDYTSSPKLKFNDAGDNVVINFAEAAKRIEYTIKGNGFSKGTFDVMESADGKTYTSVATYTELGNAVAEMKNLQSSSRYVKFVYSTKAASNGGNVAVGAIKIIAASEVENPGLAFEKETYRFMTTATDMEVKATSAKASTGAITYAAEGITIDATTGKITCNTAGEYTVTASIAAVEGYEAATATCTVIVIEPLSPDYAIVGHSSQKAYAMTTTWNSDKYFTSQELKMAGEGIYVVSKKEDMDNIFWAVTTDGKQCTIQNPNTAEYVMGDEKNVLYSAEPYTWTIDADGYLASADATPTLLLCNVSTPRFKTYASASTTCVLAEVVEKANIREGYTRTVTKGAYGTICLPKSVASYAGADFYTATVSGQEVILDPVETLEAGVPYVFKSTAETIVCAYNDEEAVTVASENGALVGVLADTDAPVGSYVLQKQTIDGETVVAFFLVGSTVPTIKANYAYLVASSGVKMLTIGGVETAISNIQSEQSADAAIYNMAGQRVSKALKGVYIINGKKVLK